MKLVEVTKKIIVVLLTIGILKQEMPKIEPIREGYVFCKIIMDIKYKLKRKLRVGKMTKRKVVVHINTYARIKETLKTKLVYRSNGI